MSFELTRRAENSPLAAPLVNQVSACVRVGGVSCKKGGGGGGGGLGDWDRYNSSTPAPQYIYLE